MTTMSFYTLSWSFRKARRFFNLFISINPNVHDALRQDQSHYYAPSHHHMQHHHAHQREVPSGLQTDAISSIIHQDPTIMSSDVLTSDAQSIHCAVMSGSDLAFPRVASESSSSLDGLPRVLRSSRQRKYRSVSDAAVIMSKARRQPLTNGVPQLRRSRRRISWPIGNIDALSLHRAPPGFMRILDEDEDNDPIPGVDSHDQPHESYVTAPSMPSHEEQSSGYSHYVTARTSFDCTLDSIDEESAVHFFSPPHHPAYDDHEFEGVDSTDPHYNRTHYVSTRSSSLSAALAISPGPAYRLNSPRLPIPSLMLTLPTPTVPVSPVFVSQSPITIPGFIRASTSITATSPRNLANLHTAAVPSMPRSDCCELAEFESETQCAECDQQWLACKIWYQANDGGRKRYLTEPYIKPAESNTRTRAMFDVLGVPGGSPGPLGLGIEFETQTPGKRRFWRFSRLLSSVPIPDRFMNLDQTRPESIHSSEGSSALLGNILIKTTAGLGRWRMKIAAFLAPRGGSVSQCLEATDSLATSASSHQLVSSIPILGPGAADGSHGPVAHPGCAESRFVEHLAGHFGNFVVRL